MIYKLTTPVPVAFTLDNAAVKNIILDYATNTISVHWVGRTPTNQERKQDMTTLSGPEITTQILNAAATIRDACLQAVATKESFPPGSMQ